MFWRIQSFIHYVPTAVHVDLKHLEITASWPVLDVLSIQPRHECVQLRLMQQVGLRHREVA